MGRIVALRCVKCGQSYLPAAVLYTCPHCGISGILDVEQDEAAISRELTAVRLAADRDFSMWRYRAALPLADRAARSPLQIGWTPLYTTGRLAAATGLARLHIKDDSRNPTASLKDRASAIAVARAAELGRTVLCTASTGNAAASLAGLAAAAGLKTYIFVPQTAPEAKIAQLLIYGAHVFLVRGDYDQAFDLCQAAAEAFGWYNRSCAVNPYLVEGKKTVAYEICEQLGWQAPDLVAVAVGDGCTLAAVWKGFRECQRFGLISRLPVLAGVQASGANPVSRAFARERDDFDYVRPETIADSIAVGRPRNGLKALRAIRESGGFMVDVSDIQILEAMRLLAQTTGIFGEPSGVTSLAGIISLQRLGCLAGFGQVVTLMTGSGLKDVRRAIQAAGSATVVDPDLASVQQALRDNKLRGDQDV